MACVGILTPLGKEAEIVHNQNPGFTLIHRLMILQGCFGGDGWIGVFSDFRNGNERYQVQEWSTEKYCPPGKLFIGGELTVYTVLWSSQDRVLQEREREPSIPIDNMEWEEALSDYRVIAGVSCWLLAADWRVARLHHRGCGQVCGVTASVVRPLRHTYSFCALFTDNTSGESNTCVSFKLCQTFGRKPGKTFQKQ